MALSSSQTHFSNVPRVDIQRSKFHRPSQHKTTFNTGDLIPLYVDEVLPGDTRSMDMAAVVRSQTPIVPVMDNANLDVYWFFVPNRLVWEHWEEFNGQNNTTYWEQPVEYEIPQCSAPLDEGWLPGTIADYMGIPTQKTGFSVSALPFRAYGLIYNEWFRDQNLKSPCVVYVSDTAPDGANYAGYVTGVQRGGYPAKAAKYHDYFTSCLPAPQKGPDVLLPIGSAAPINAYDPAHPSQFHIPGNALVWHDLKNNEAIAGPATLGVSNLAGPYSPTTLAAGFSGVNRLLTPANLFADLSQATAATVNELRLSFALQRLYERDARGGSRYTEILRSHFGVTSPDSRLQRPEYLGGKRIPIGMSQVLQTSASSSTPQGNTAAYSLTNMASGMFTKSFVEHGILMCLGVVRTEHTYQQGLDRFWTRKRRYDFYDPALANIGEQAVLNKEIYLQGNAEDNQAFGYQEAWADYRYKPSRVSGEMRSNYAQSLDFWHYADYYTSRPNLGSDWIDETKVNVDRTIAVQASNANQFFGDFLFRDTCVRPMPLYSVPGMIDHY